MLGTSVDEEIKVVQCGQDQEQTSIEYESFLEKLHLRKATMGIIGMGYVGFPLALTFTKARVKTIGFDIDQEKVDSINAGKSYFEHLTDDCITDLVGKSLLSASSDFSKVSLCDVIVICVPTPLTHHLEPDLSYIEKTCLSIAPHLNPHTLVCLESTTWPGTTQEVLARIIEEKSALRRGKDLYLAFSPEREDPGNKDFDTKTISKVVGGIDSKSLELAKTFYSLAIDNVVEVSSVEVAEASKLLENIFRSVNIALVNELKVIFDKMNIDVWEVIRAASTKPFGYMPFWPGPGLGGHCIPIDPFYLTWKAKEWGISTRFIELSGQINRAMPAWVVSKVQDCLNGFSKALKGSKILILGLAYKADISDLRESPSLKLMELLEQKGVVVEYNDPHISEVGMTREYPQFANYKSREISGEYDCFLLSTAHSVYNPQAILAYGVPIIDTRNFFPKHERVYPA